MRYVTSIVATAFCLLSCAAFATQIAWYGLTSPAQCIVLFVLIALTILLWISEIISDQNVADRGLVFRVIPNNTVFPAVAFVIQYIITLLYSAAWFPLIGIPATGLRAILPQGIFIPLGIEFVLLTIMGVLWAGNNATNKHTVTVEHTNVAKQMVRSQLQSQVSMLQQRVSAQDATIMRQIKQKVESLPLQVQPDSNPMLQQAYQLMVNANQAPQAPQTKQLREILRVVSQIR